MNTKRGLKIKLTAMALCAATFGPNLFAQINVPSDGSDLALNIISSTNIDLSQAVATNWTVASPIPGKGIYDSNQWAVVFKYTSVNIAAGAIVTFSNHPTHAPVVWLVSGNVTNAGIISLDGNDNANDPVNLPDPGPGGFRGGGSGNGSIPGFGFGPGGGNVNGGLGFGGTYLNVYGSSNIIPLIGGSGGAGGGNASSGGAGGGALLIAAAGSITNSNSIHANGGAAGSNAGAGSGGGIRLVASQILGVGTVQVEGGIGSHSSGGPGRIRIESINTPTLTYGSSTPSPLTLTNGATPQIFPTNPVTTVTIVGIVQGGQTNVPPGDPTAVMSPTGNDDVRIVTQGPSVILVQTRNFPTNGTVQVYLKVRNDFSLLNNESVINGAVCFSGNSNLANWSVTNSIPIQVHTILQVRAFY